MNTERETMNEEIVSKGITEDYIWHEAKSIRTKLKSAQSEFEEFVSVMSKRDKDNRAVLAKLYAENHQLTQENYLLKSQVETLMEEWRKNNGPTT
jgi:cell division protein FtsB